MVASNGPLFKAFTSTAFSPEIRIKALQGLSLTLLRDAATATDPESRAAALRLAVDFTRDLIALEGEGL